MSTEEKLSQGQTIWVSYRVEKEMSLNEARESIQSVTPGTFKVNEVSASPFNETSAH